MELLEEDVWGDVQRKDTGKSKRKDPPDSDPASLAIWTRDTAPDKENNKETGGGRNENVQMSVWQDQKRQSEMKTSGKE